MEALTDSVLHEIDPKFLKIDLVPEHRERIENLYLSDHESEDDDNSDEECISNEVRSINLHEVENIDKLYDHYSQLYEKSKGKHQINDSTSGVGDYDEEVEHKTATKRTSRSRSRSRSRTSKNVKISNLTRFPIHSIEDSTAILLNGKKKSGKSITIGNILLWKNTPRIVVFGGGRDWKSWEGRVGFVYLETKFSEDRFKALMDSQEQLLKLKEKPGFENLNIDLIVVLEDFSADPKVMRSKALSDLQSNGRRLHILFLCSAQHLKHLRPDIRTQFDIYFLFKEKNFDNRKNLYEAVGAYFDSKDEFYQLLDATTKEKRVFVVNNSSEKTENIEDFAHFFKGKLYPPRQLGSFLYKMFNELYYQESEEENNSELQRMLEEEALRNAPKVAEIQKPKVILQINDADEIPTEEIENVAQKKGVFEVVASSGKKNTNIITFSE